MNLRTLTLGVIAFGVFHGISLAGGTEDWIEDLKTIVPLQQGQEPSDTPGEADGRLGILNVKWLGSSPSHHQALKEAGLPGKGTVWEVGQEVGDEQLLQTLGNFVGTSQVISLNQLLEPGEFADTVNFRDAIEKAAAEANADKLFLFTLGLGALRPANERLRAPSSNQNRRYNRPSDRWDYRMDWRRDIMASGVALLIDLRTETIEGTFKTREKLSPGNLSHEQAKAFYEKAQSQLFTKLVNELTGADGALAAKTQ